MSRTSFHVINAGLVMLLASAGAAAGAVAGTGVHGKCLGTQVVATNAPVPADPYPLMAAGWGPELGKGLMASRWAEDWSGMAAAGRAPALKAIPLGSGATLALSGEARLRYVTSGNAQLSRGNDIQQAQFRGILGADLRINPNIRVYGELGTGHVDEHRDTATANFQNVVSLQQLFVDVREHVGSALVGAMVGRQEFSDGPRQLVSLSDGPNLHRSWNGIRAYVHGERQRFGAFDLRATRLQRGAFDEEINSGERLQGVNASFVVSPADGPNTYLEPFWIHSENPAFRIGGRAGLDDRNTFGARLWGRRGKFRFDWVAARQTGRSIDNRRVDAWGVFAVQSLDLGDGGWKPRLTSHVDIASGARAYGSGTLAAFNPLYASSNYLGEGQFLGLSNLLLIAPGLAMSPTPKTTLSFEYGYARRLEEHDVAYAGGMRAYAGTQAVPGHRLGGLFRLAGSWAATTRLTVSLNYEQFDAGEVLERAGFYSGSYGYFNATYRY